MTYRHANTVAAAAAVLLAACSGGGAAPSDTTRSAVSAEPTTSNAAESTAAATTSAAATTTAVPAPQFFGEPGPYPVGALTLDAQLPDGLVTKVEVWYPAAEPTASGATIGYDLRDYTPQAVRDLLTADVPATFSVPGARDVDAADGTFPLVLFSHGFSGVRVQSTFLTSHLASWGFVVAAPDHSARTLSTVLGSGPATPSDPVQELLAALDTVTAEPSPLAAVIDAGNVIALGHSAGGFTVATAAAADDRIDGFVSMASGSNAQGTAPATTPSFFIAGSLDAVVPPADRTEPAFEAAASPSLYWLIDGVGHNGFDDFCTFGNGTGIIGVAEASGLEALLDAQPQFRTLGEDGCLPPALPVVDTFPVITHAVTAWIRWQTGADPDPVALGLDDSPLPFDDVTVTVRSR